MGRAEQGQRTRAALLLAAASEFEQRGYAATSLTDVSDRLGLVRATVHFHFATKKHLADALVAHLARCWHDIRVTQTDSAPVGGLGRLRWESEQVVVGYLADPRQRAGLRLAIEPDLRPETDLAEAWIDHVAELLSASGQAGRAGLLVHSFAGILVWAGREQRDAESLVADYWDLWKEFSTE